MEKNSNNDILSRIYKKDKLKRFIEMFIGLLIISFSFNLLCRPNNLVAGGLSGLSIITEELFGINPSVFIMAGNAILLILSFIFLGKEKTIHTVIGAILYPILIALTANITKYINIEQEAILLYVIFAGVLQGLGFGMVYKAGYATGGTDIINQILSKYLKMSMGSAIYITDGIVILLSGYTFGFTRVLYGILLMYIISYMVDRVIIGISSSKAFYIITKEPEKTKKYVIETLHHNVTNIKAIGGYTNEKTAILMTVLPTKEYYKFKKGILEIDKEAFFVVTDAYEVMGGE